MEQLNIFYREATRMFRDSKHAIVKEEFDADDYFNIDEMKKFLSEYVIGSPSEYHSDHILLGCVYYNKLEKSFTFKHNIYSVDIEEGKKISGVYISCILNYITENILNKGYSVHALYML